MAIKLQDAPAPDLLIEYPDGSVMPLMFHFAIEGHDLGAIATEAGFETRWQDLDERDEPDLYADYFEHGADDVIGRWNVVAPDGWQLGGKWDTEDGPTACFLRRKVA